MNATLGIDIGGTKTLAALVGPDGAVLDRARADTPAAQGPDAVLRTAAHLARRLGGAGPVGVGAAGLIDPATGVVRYATDSLPGWAGTPVADALARRIGRPVVVDNDVNAAALGESWAGAARGRAHVLLVAVGTGLGGGLVRGGAVDHGARGGAGETAHLPAPDADELPCGCGRTGHLEGVASGTGLARAYRLRTGVDVTGREVAARCSAGDPAAVEVLATAGHALGRALAGLVALLDPQTVVVAGGAGRALLPYARSAYDAERLPVHADVSLVPAALGDAAVAVGAARAAMVRRAVCPPSGPGPAGPGPAGPGPAGPGSTGPGRVDPGSVSHGSAGPGPAGPGPAGPGPAERGPRP
ncbi:ROK family protein [Kitasatospora sp. NPDC059463]|uniref:ROK family protein n=1 Tax=Kitasatospora sp. NPDC059463 TaxID=3346842 RepID=UPI0036A8F443